MAKEVAFRDTPRPPDIDLRKYKQRDLSQTLFFKVACRTFGPPKSRIRRIVAPPMQKVEFDAESGVNLTGKSSAGSGVTETPREDQMPGTEGAEQNVSDWISERKKLRAQLDSMGDLERWLQGKPDLTALETRVRDKMAERRSKSQMSQQTNQDTAGSVVQRNVPRSSRHSAVAPSIQQPDPEALAILDRYLHQHRLRLVDLYNQTDKRKRKEISSKDLKSVRKEADIPLSDLQFDGLVISLGSKNPNHMNYKELSVGRHLWWKRNMEEQRKGESVCPKTGASVQFFRPPSDQRSDSGDTKPSSPLSVSLRSGGDTKSRSQPGRSDQSEAGKPQFLQVPPVSLEEKRPLSYKDMEEIGKNYRERKRRAKSNTRLLDWLDQCRSVRTGNARVDAHCLPSTLGEESADLVERFRRQGLQQYHRILKLCRAHDVPLTEELLEKALLYPGDKLIRESGDQLPLRQPGVGLSSKDRFVKKISATQEPEGRHGVDEDPDRSPGLCSGPYPPHTYVAWVRTKVRGKKRSGTETLRCWTTFEQFQEMSGNLKRRFPHCFFTSDDNVQLMRWRYNPPRKSSESSLSGLSAQALSLPRAVCEGGRRTEPVSESSSIHRLSSAIQAVSDTGLSGGLQKTTARRYLWENRAGGSDTECVMSPLVVGFRPGKKVWRPVRDTGLRFSTHTALEGPWG
ncbi:PREDICTED: EF-hand calcium-binding domain-containing protein 12 [Nanorana parkeri]|uniref:EF-hand calcium-binding domain-containing protein 12 n=1 Tax=Nanorana parkeri TaxID=125878 RepID=UPI0008541052|nr:PREDICTED: EF-hand calcium-binding domain-containing protein 12 [Nanorana parkeri]